jgi:hypothetical protein
MMTAQTGSITGSVVDQLGKPVAGATVSVGVAIANQLVSQMTITAASKWVAYVATASDGSFKVTNLPPATYVLCAESQAAALLSNCQWAGSPTPPTVDLVAGQASSGIVIKGVKGSTLQIRINDPLGALAALITSALPTKIQSGVFGQTAIYYPTHVASTDLLGQTHTVNIPFDVDLKYSISSGQIKMADSAGAALPSTGALLSFRHTSGATVQPSFTFSTSK